MDWHAFLPEQNSGARGTNYVHILRVAQQPFSGLPYKSRRIGHLLLDEHLLAESNKHGLGRPITRVLSFLEGQ